MREYGSDLHFICRESQTLAKKRFSLHCAKVTVLQQ